MNNRHIVISLRTGEDDWHMTRTNIRAQPITLRPSGENQMTLDESQLTHLQKGLEHELGKLSELGWFKQPREIKLSYHKAPQEMQEGDASTISVVTLNYEEGDPQDLLLQGWLSLVGVRSQTTDEQVDEIVESGDLSDENVKELADWVKDQLDPHDLYLEPHELPDEDWSE